jgi:hypothetical protein
MLNDFLILLIFRQLTSDSSGLPIFEIYFAEANGGYNLQVQCFTLNKSKINVQVLK